MAVSSIDLKEIGEIKIYRRKGLKNIRLRVDNDGLIKLSLPWFVTKRAGLLFVRSKKDWVQQQLKAHPKTVKDIKFIGKYVLKLKRDAIKRPQIKIQENSILITLPKGLANEKEHKLINKTIEEILRKQTQTEVVARLKKIATSNNISYRSVKVKKLKSRWGSCDQQKNITLNLYLSQLPNEICDYVLAHELAHTKHLNHSREFWLFVKQINPKYVENKRKLAKYSPGKLNVR